MQMIMEVLLAVNYGYVPINIWHRSHCQHG